MRGYARVQCEVAQGHIVGLRKGALWGCALAQCRCSVGLHWGAVQGCAGAQHGIAPGGMVNHYCPSPMGGGAGPHWHTHPSTHPTTSASFQL